MCTSLLSAVSLHLMDLQQRLRLNRMPSPPARLSAHRQGRVARMLSSMKSAAHSDHRHAASLLLCTALKAVVRDNTNGSGDPRKLESVRIIRTIKASVDAMVRNKYSTV